MHSLILVLILGLASLPASAGIMFTGVTANLTTAPDGDGRILASLFGNFDGLGDDIMRPIRRKGGGGRTAQG